MSEVYDLIGRTYTATRGADPHVARTIHAALGEAVTVLDVGAGTGTYEPDDRRVLAVEPSATMRRARPAGAAPCVSGRAEALPVVDDGVDAAMAILTVHHWDDPAAGLRELVRVARRRVVVLHWDQDVMDRFWLADYVPEAFAFDRARAPSLTAVVDALRGAGEPGPGSPALAVDVAPVPVPHDCRDGFAGAFWRRPHAYLDPVVRAGISLLAQTEHRRGDGWERLRRDLRDGTWAARHRHLLTRHHHDCGYRLITARWDPACGPRNQPRPTRGSARSWPATTPGAPRR